MSTTHDGWRVGSLRHDGRATLTVYTPKGQARVIALDEHDLERLHQATGHALDVARHHQQPATGGNKG